MKFEELVVNYLGELGRYQKIQFLLVCLPTAFTAMHALSWTFTAANSPHRFIQKLIISFQYVLDADCLTNLPMQSTMSWPVEISSTELLTARPSFPMDIVLTKVVHFPMVRHAPVLSMIEAI